LATVGTPTVNVTTLAADHLEVSGTVLVSALTGCPANVRVTVKAEDTCGLTAQLSDDIQVIDTTAPEITLTLNRTSLWPPNHKLVTIVVTPTGTDNCPG